MPETSFCRRCGAPISTPQPDTENERTTKLFDEGEGVATHRLDPRPTSPGRDPLHITPAANPSQLHSGRNKLVLLTLIILVLLVGIASTVAIMRHRNDRTSRTVDALTYPGAQKSLDIVSEGGGHTVKLETQASFDDVRDWYQRTLEPEKVMQLTTFSVVMKNEKTTATIVREGDTTNILLKIIP